MNTKIISNIAFAIALMAIVFFPYVSLLGIQLSFYNFIELAIKSNGRPFGYESNLNNIANIIMMVYLLIGVFGFSSFTYPRIQDKAFSGGLAICTILIAYFILHEKVSMANLEYGAFAAILGFSIPILIYFSNIKSVETVIDSHSPKGKDIVLKVCPNCAEEIRINARVCRFCNYQYTEMENKKIQNIEKEQAEMKPKKLIIKKNN